MISLNRCVTCLLLQFKASLGMVWTKASDSIRTNMAAIFEKDDGPAGTYYRSCMDLEHIDAQGHSMMDPWLKAIDDIKDKDSLIKTITDFNKEGMDVLFEWGIDKDPRSCPSYSAHATDQPSAN
jgi:predicted metalloendopeptidase